MKPRGLAVVLFLFAVTLPALAAEPIRIAVIDFTSKGGIDPTRMDSLQDLLATEIRKAGDFQVLGRSDIATALKVEEQKRLFECSEDSCLAEVGGALGVRWAVAGNVGLFGDAYLLNLKLMDVVQIRVIRSVSRKVEGGEARLLDALGDAVREMLDDFKAEAMAAERPAPAAGAQAAVSQAPFRLRTFGHIAFWSGLGLAAFGGAAAGVAASAADAYDRGENIDTNWDKSRTWSGLMWAGLGTGAALMATGVVLWLLPAEPPLTTSLLPAADGTGLVWTLHGVF